MFILCTPFLHVSYLRHVDFFSAMSRRVCLVRGGVSILSDNCSKDSAAEEEKEIRENADECSDGGLQPYTQSLSGSAEVWH